MLARYFYKNQVDVFYWSADVNQLSTMVFLNRLKKDLIQQRDQIIRQAIMVYRRYFSMLFFFLPKVIFIYFLDVIIKHLRVLLYRIDLFRDSIRLYTTCKLLLNHHHHHRHRCLSVDLIRNIRCFVRHCFAYLLLH